MSFKKLLPIIYLIFLLAPMAAPAAFPIATGNRKVLVIWNNDVAYDDYIAEGGSGNNLIDLLSSTGGTWAGNGFNFSVDTLKVPSTFNTTAPNNTWATAQSAVSQAVAAGKISALTAQNYCVVFDIRFVNNNAVASGGTQAVGTVAGDTITQGDITEYQNYLASGAGGLFIMGDNYYYGACGSGSETGFISREENMNALISGIALTGFTGGSCAIGVGPLVNTGDYEIIPSPGNPYTLDSNFNSPLPTIESDYSGPVSIANLGSGQAWFQHQSDPWAVGIAWSGATALQTAYDSGRMLYWGDSSMLSRWAGGTGDAGLPVYIENAVAFLDQDSCCMPSTTPVCGGPDVKLTSGNPSVVACFESNNDGWTTGTWTNTQDADSSGGGSLQNVLSAYQSDQVMFGDSFAADTLALYDQICFQIKNTSTASVDFQIMDSQWGTVIAGPFTVPGDSAWHSFCETLGGDFASTSTLVFRENYSNGASPVTFYLDSVRLRFSCSSHLYLRDPACCSVANTPTPTNTSSPTNTITPSPTSTATKTNTNTATLQNTATVTNSQTDTPSPTVTNTNTETPVNTYTNTFTSTYTPTVTNSQTNTETLLDTATNTFTPTVTNSQTPTNSMTPSATVTNSYTPVPSATATNTYTVSPTNTTSYTPTMTSTLAPNTATNTMSPTNTQSSTATPPSSVSIVKIASETVAKSGDDVTYTIGVTVTGNSILSGAVTDAFPANMTFVGVVSTPTGASGSPTSTGVQWNLPSPASPGTYTFVYTLQVNNFAPAGQLLNNAKVTYTGGQQSAQAPVTVLGNFTVSVNIYNSAGEVVKTIPTKQFSTAITNITLSTTNTITTLQGPGSTIDILYDGVIIGVWDGTNNQNQPVGNGTYKVQIDNSSATGTVTSVAQNAVVNRSLSNVEVDIFNAAGEVVKKLYEVISNGGTYSMTNVSLSASEIRPSAAVTANSNPNSASVSIYVTDTNAPVTLAWDGTNNEGTYVSPGEYEVQVHWTDGNGDTTNITKSLLVLPQTISGKVVAKPNVLDAKSNLTTHIDASGIAGATSVKVNIYTIAGELVKPPLTGPPQYTTWTPSALGLASGIYIAVVDVNGPDGGLLVRQTVKLLYMH